MRRHSLSGLIVIAVIVCLVMALMCGAGVLAREDDSAGASGESGFSSAESGELSAEDQSLYVNNVCIGSCVMISDVPYVDVDAFCEAIGLDASVSGDGTHVALNDEGITLTAETGSRYAVCNDRYFYIANGVSSVNGAPALPFELLVELLGINAEWDSDNNMISVTDTEIHPIISGDRFYDDTELYWISRFIYAEAGDADLEEQVALGQLILNRVTSTDYEDNVYDVIFSKNQFEVVINGMIYMVPDEDAVIAAKMALEGANVIGNATEFAAGSDESSGEFIIQIGDYRFYSPA